MLLAIRIKYSADGYANELCFSKSRHGHIERVNERYYMPSALHKRPWMTSKVL